MGKSRPMVQSDRESVKDILAAVGNFTADEIKTALELVDEWLASGEASGYLTYVLESGSDPFSIVGYMCFGEAPLTTGTYDLYWIAVDTKHHRGGFGKKLVRFAEEEIVRRGGRMLLIETSSLETYGATIKFYEGAGYEIAARIKDYYKPGDDKLIFYKRFSSG
ncbi:MAG: GNAT family N-acetyltransferase [Gemmatimonadaceae bacterium]|nr:GNAT family N-acetyltransferase [Gemmatimonadaceae bacterium]